MEFLNLLENWLDKLQKFVLDIKYNIPLKNSINITIQNFILNFFKK